MTDVERLEDRLSSLERVVVDGDATLDELAELTSVAETVSDLETRIDEHERRLAELEAAVRSLEGYVGNVESINDDVERQSTAALATVDRLERRVETLEVELDGLAGGILEDEAVGGTDQDDADTDGTDGSAAETDLQSDDEAVFSFPDPDRTDESSPERSARDVLDVGADGSNEKPAEDGASESDPESAPSQSGTGPGTDSTHDGGLIDSLRSRLQ